MDEGLEDRIGKRNLQEVAGRYPKMRRLVKM